MSPRSVARLAAVCSVAFGGAGAAACGGSKKVEGFPDSYAGVGLELTVEGDIVRVVRPLKGGPSEAAGVKVGDEVTAINGQSTKGLSLGDVVTRLRGQPESQLTLALSRNGERIIVVMKRRKLTKVAGEDYRPVPGR